jgi:hypothetical protein
LLFITLLCVLRKRLIFFFQTKKNQTVTSEDSVSSLQRASSSGELNISQTKTKRKNSGRGSGNFFGCYLFYSYFIFIFFIFTLFFFVCL